jgi:DNA-binding FrmR family transcriptional regulator
MMTTDVKEKVEARLRRAAGQVAGIQRMVADDRYCIDVLTQIAAARAALDKAGKILLESHIRTCVTDAFDGQDSKEREAKIAELVAVFDRHCGA